MVDANQIMRGMGFPDSENGRYVSELRANTEKEIKRGLNYRSPGTWEYGAEELTYEERAKAILAMDWANENGYSYKVEYLDPVFMRQIDLRTMRRHWVVDWKRLPAAFRDAVRRVKYLMRRPFLPRNPYV